MSDDTAPESSPVELLALKAQTGGQPEHDALISAFLDAVAVVPSGSDPAKGAFEPVLVEIDGVTHMLVCDSLAAVRGATNLAPFAVSMRGIDVVRGVTPGNALLVRTPRTGFAIDEDLLNEIRSR
ncbi:hypothetical protein [Marisediminicola sp. LYQ134]|uniref:hypothetical protein n=1 Tax=Marisediminicola sp. LYQ134 TaxID=3391061 RepID=UPI0039838579